MSVPRRPVLFLAVPCCPLSAGRPPDCPACRSPAGCPGPPFAPSGPVPARPARKTFEKKYRFLIYCRCFLPGDGGPKRKRLIFRRIVAESAERVPFCPFRRRPNAADFSRNDRYRARCTHFGDGHLFGFELFYGYVCPQIGMYHPLLCVHIYSTRLSHF